MRDSRVFGDKWSFWRGVSNPQVWGWDIVKAFRLRAVECLPPFVGFSNVSAFIR